MVRLWSEEVGDARSVIEPVVRSLGADVAIQINGGKGFSGETVEVTLKRSKRQARCVVTFEAWENARTNPEEMKAAFRQIIGEMEDVSPLPVYLLTSRGLSKETGRKEPEVLRGIAAGVEADVLADEFFRKGLRK